MQIQSEAKLVVECVHTAELTSLLFKGYDSERNCIQNSISTKGNTLPIIQSLPSDTFPQPLTANRLLSVFEIAWSGYF